MKSDQESASFGRYLQTMRLEKGIRLETIAAETRISLKILQGIENEDYRQLPNEVFVKGFIRTYARAVGADENEALGRYQSRLQVVRRLIDAPGNKAGSGSGLWWKFLLSLVMMALIVFLSIYTTRCLNMGPVGDQSAARRQSVAKQPAAGPKVAPPPSAPEKSMAAADHQWLLHITAREDTWMKIIADSGKAAEYNLKSGEHLEIGASSGFNLLLGNARGVSITLNDKPVPVSGKSGEMVNLHLP